MSEVVQVALIASIAPIIVALSGLVFSILNHLKLQKVDRSVNGRLSELLRLTAEHSEAKGEITGALKQKAQQSPPPPPPPPPASS